MKSIMIGIVLMVAISAAAWGVLSTQFESSSADAYTSSNDSVRLN